MSIHQISSTFDVSVGLHVRKMYSEFEEYISSTDGKNGHRARLLTEILKKKKYEISKYVFPFPCVVWRNSFNKYVTSTLLSHRKFHARSSASNAIILRQSTTT